MSEAATEHANTVSIEDAGPSRKRISIEIPAEAVDEHLGQAIDLAATEVQIPGFRKGHAPRPLIEKKFGETIRGEAKSRLVASAYQQAVEDHKLRVVGEPVADELDDAVVEMGKPFAFVVDVEVSPEFDLPSLDSIEITRPGFEVTDEMVSAELDKLCINEGDLEQREAPEPGDYLTGHGVMVGSTDDQGNPREFYNIKGAVVQVPTPDKQGRGMILGVMVEDFADQFGLPSPGQTATIRVKGPEHHEVESIRGEDLTITFEVERVDRIIPAELPAVVEAYGFQSEEQLREAIRARLTQRAIINQQFAMRQQVADYLLRNTELELPERLTDRQATRRLERRRMELMYRGVDPAEIEEHMAELRAASLENAQRELKLFFILHHVAEQLEVGVQEAEVNGHIARMAAERGVRPEKLRQELINENRIAQIAEQIREHKALDVLISKASVTDADQAEPDSKA